MKGWQSLTAHSLIITQFIFAVNVLCIALWDKDCYNQIVAADGSKERRETKKEEWSTERA
ncbi:MAG: hypothetical protein NC254_03170 [bacterium]|nr:hypothetical protein [bacterium]